MEITVSEAHRRTGYDKDHIRYLCKTDRIDARWTIDKRWAINWESLENYKREQDSRRPRQAIESFAA